MINIKITTLIALGISIGNIVLCHLSTLFKHVFNFCLTLVHWLSKIVILVYIIFQCILNKVKSMVQPRWKPLYQLTLYHCWSSSCENIIAQHLSNSFNDCAQILLFYIVLLVYWLIKVSLVALIFIFFFLRGVYFFFGLHFRWPTRIILEWFLIIF